MREHGAATARAVNPAAAPAPAPVPVSVPAAGPPPTPALPLTRRASLNVVAIGLDFGVRTAVGLVITPLLVERLGAALFGVWEILGRLAGYVAAIGGRPAEALRLVVANRQTAADPATQRRAVGSALVVWLLFLPLAALSGALLAWYAPTLSGAPSEWHTAIRLSAALLYAGGLMGALLALPESALQGMNLGYKRMELQAGLNIAGGLLTAGAVYAGLGLVGLSGAQVILAGLSGLCFWTLARSYVGWFGVARPARAEVKSVLGLSAWLSGGDLISKLLVASDVLILGMLLSPTVVTTYVLTAYAPRAAVAIHDSAVAAALPGLGGLIGDRQYDRATLVRRELLALTWLFATAVGVTILLWNRSFVALWVGADHYAGPAVDLLIVLMAAQTAFIRVDAYVIDAALQSWLRVLIGAGAVVVTIALAVLLTRAWGLPGLCVGVLTGRLTQTLAYPVLARRSVGGGAVVPLGVARALLVTALVFAAAVYGGERLAPAGWLGWTAGVAVTGALALGVAFAAGLSSESQHAVVRRLTEMARKRTPRKPSI
jgi:O-antigen/teichoic acid export membrane protein